MRRRISIRGCVRPSVRVSVRGSVSIKEKRGLGASYVGYPNLFFLQPISFTRGQDSKYIFNIKLLCWIQSSLHCFFLTRILNRNSALIEKALKNYTQQVFFKLRL